jgi:hypothetical protein
VKTVTGYKRCRSSVCWEEGIDIVQMVTHRCVLKSKHKGDHASNHRGTLKRFTWKRGNRYPD